jgi:hypothetical protein
VPRRFSTVIRGLPDGAAQHKIGPLTSLFRGLIQLVGRVKDSNLGGHQPAGIYRKVFIGLR